MFSLQSIFYLKEKETREEFDLKMNKILFKYTL